MYDTLLFDKVQSKLRKSQGVSKNSRPEISSKKRSFKLCIFLGSNFIRSIVILLPPSSSLTQAYVHLIY